MSAYDFFDQNLRYGLKTIEKYVTNGLTVQADTIEGLAELIDVDPATLARTLSDWNGYMTADSDEALDHIAAKSAIDYIGK